MAERKYTVTMQGKDKQLVHVSLLATSPEEAEHLARRSQYRREERFPLTFARLDQALADGGKLTGPISFDPRAITIDPKDGSQALTIGAVKAEIEKRKADQDRYGGGGLKVLKVEVG